METTDIRKDRWFERLSDRQICILLYLFCFLMMTVMGSVLSISYILDETGTVANAAFLAGYYSYFKNEGYANVDYTEKKHIRKAKSSPLGMVYYDNYKTMFVDFKDKLYDDFKN